MKSILLLALLATASAINPIIIKGNKFFDSTTGDQFYVKGVDYQPSATADPLSDEAGLDRDIPLLTELGVNTIRVYQSSSTADHTAAMNKLAEAGIYVLIDATDPKFSISSSNPSWDLTIFSGIKTKIDNFIAFPNLLGFIGGNEVITRNNETAAAAYIKASIRDIKAYIKSKGYTTPVGYAATDIDVNKLLQEYLDCGSRDSSVDFYGINTYRWCGDATFEQSRYQEFVDDFSNYHAPFIFTEYGCNEPSPRIFGEVEAIYGAQMTSFLSGGFVYEWSQEDNNYGLVSISNGVATKTVDFDNLKKQLTAVNPQKATLSTYTGSSNNVDACPSTSSDFTSVSSPLPPAASEDVCSCMFNQLTCVTKVTDTSAVTVEVAAQIAASLDYVCSQLPSACVGISSSSTTGQYGLYSACNSVQKASYALNIYHNQFSSVSDDSCNFNGLANLVTPSKQCASGVTFNTNAPTQASTTSSTNNNNNANPSTTRAPTGSSGSSTGSSDTVTEIERPQDSAAGVMVPIVTLIAVALAMI